MMRNRGLITKKELFKEALEYDQKYLQAVIHAVELYDRPEDVRSTIHRFLSRENKAAFHVTNPHSKRLWFETLIDSYLNSNLKDMRSGEGETLLVCSLVTFTHREWVFPHTHIGFDLERAKQKVRNAMGRFSYLACFEAAYYVNEEWRDREGNVGDLVSFHCHAVVWAKNKYQLRLLRKRAAHRFEPILGNASGMNFKTLKTTDDASRAIRYQCKMPLKGYKTVNEGNNTRQENVLLSARHRFRLFKALKDYDLLDFWLAGNEGGRIVRLARASLNRRRLKSRQAPEFKARARNGERIGARALAGPLA